MTHPANSLPFLHGAKRCGQCLHFDPVLSCCDASKDHATTSRSWAACVRYLPFGRVGRFLSVLSRHPRTTALSLLGAFVGQVALVTLLAIR